MNTKQFRKLVWLAPIALVMIAWQPPANLSAQAAKPAAPAGQVNIVKEIMDHKDTLNWKPAPKSGEPTSRLQRSKPPRTTQLG